jgi:hypothetical protein
MQESRKTAKKSFVLYSDLLARTEKLSLEQKGLLFQAILEYQNGVEPVIDDIKVEAFFDFIRPDLEKNNEKYEKICERNRQNGLKGGRSPQAENPKNPVDSSGSKPAHTPPKNLENDNENDRKNITAGAVTEFLAGKFESKRRRSPNFSWQSDAQRLAELLKLDLDATFEKKKGGKSYKIADSWYRLFRDGGEQTAARLEAAYRYFADQERFFTLPPDVKWGYLRDIAHHGLTAVQAKGLFQPR